MKKLFVFLASLVLLISVSSCSSCTNQAKNFETETTEQVVEHMIALDREAMFMNYADDYRWFETCVQLNDWLDEECDGSFNLVTNVFQTVVARDAGSYDTRVIKYQHINGETREDTIDGFWIEDLPLEEETIKVTFAEAFEKVMETNLPKPHTHQVVLRKEVGPNPCNPQWIFGNLRSQIYVDAVTGEVSNVSPAFNGLNIGTPLGEWP